MLRRWSIFVATIIVALLIGFCFGSVFFVNFTLDKALKSVVSNGSLDTYAFVTKYTPLLDKLDVSYPEGVAVLEEIFIWSKFYRVDPDSVIILVYVESGLNPSATGKYGEIGLFQLMPTTAFSFYPNTLITSLDLYDIHTNVICGIACWKSCLEGANGDYDLARRYYNGGPRYAYIEQVTNYVAMHHGAAKRVRKIISGG